MWKTHCCDTILYTFQTSFVWSIDRVRWTTTTISYKTDCQGWSSIFSFSSWFAFVLTLVMGDLMRLRVTYGEFMNWNKFSNLKERYCKMVLVFPERLQWTPAAPWWTSAHRRPSANGFTTKGASQYGKSANVAADVHPEDRQEISFFSFSKYYFSTKSPIDFIQFSFCLNN